VALKRQIQELGGNLKQYQQEHQTRMASVARQADSARRDSNTQGSQYEQIQSTVNGLQHKVGHMEFILGQLQTQYEKDLKLLAEDRNSSTPVTLQDFHASPEFHLQPAVEVQSPVDMNLDFDFARDFARLQQNNDQKEQQPLTQKAKETVATVPTAKPDKPNAQNKTMSEID
jgi:hypothetical protein